jgi:hypothetical protein
VIERTKRAPKTALPPNGVLVIGGNHVLTAAALKRNFLHKKPPCETQV